MCNYAYLLRIKSVEVSRRSVTTLLVWSAVAADVVFLRRLQKFRLGEAVVKVLLVALQKASVLKVLVVIVLLVKQKYVFFLSLGGSGTLATVGARGGRVLPQIVIESVFVASRRVHGSQTAGTVRNVGVAPASVVRVVHALRVNLRNRGNWLRFLEHESA